MTTQPDLPDVSRLRAIVDGWAGRRVLLVGDVAADHYITGRTHRISREAPVLIVRQTGESIVPGQAGNAAVNLAALGARVTLGTLAGADPQAEPLRQALKKAGVACDGWMPVHGGRTVSKTRILAGSHHTRLQQLLRLDRDEPPPPAAAGEARGRLRHWLEGALAAADIVAVSDYGYDTLDDELWAWLRERTHTLGRELVLDSRHRLGRWRGADLVTPNEWEAMETIGQEGATEPLPPARLARRTVEATGARHLLLKRGNEGMCLLSAKKLEEDPDHEPTRFGVFGRDEAVDTNGAGDTVLATATLARAAGATQLEAAHLANIAAGLTVLKIGAASTTPDELHRALDSWPQALQPAG